MVLLNGVSGPATLALAQILTGGGVHATSGMSSESEVILEKINRALDTPDSIGVEAIVEVKIIPPPTPPPKESPALDPTYMDSRYVASWRLIREPLPIIRRAK